MKTQEERITKAIERLTELAPTVKTELPQVQRNMALAYLHGRQDERMERLADRTKARLDMEELYEIVKPK